MPEVHKPLRGPRYWLAAQGIAAPQFAAAGLLLVYVLQCLWLIHIEVRNHSIPDSDRALRVYYGRQQWRGGPVAGTPDSQPSEAATGMPSSARRAYRMRDGFDQDHSPFYYLISAAAFEFWPRSWIPPLLVWQLLATLPYLFFGVMLGGSVWYVSRRLYGNAGGYIALILYCFSPATIANVAGWTTSADMGAVWGAFGAVFTAIAVAHTLYAPREVVLWNWRRILLLGLSLALAIGNQFSLVLMAPLAFFFMLWVASVRPRAVVAIWTAAVAIALFIFFASYFFDPDLFWQGLLHARWFDFEPRAFIAPLSYLSMWQTMAGGSPALVLAVPACVLSFVAWKRARYFGNAAPLLVAVLLICLALAAPEFAGDSFLVAALAFLFVFVAGIFADLLETPYQLFVKAGLVGLLLASALWNILQLARIA